MLRFTPLSSWWSPWSPARSVETRSLPTLTRSYPRRFTFYVAEPLSSILDAIGIHLHSLKVAGGIILFLFGLQMLFGTAEAKAGSPEAGRDLAVFPMAVPSIAGPGAMMAVILLTDNDVYTVPEQIETGVVLLVVLLLTYVLLLFSDAILRVIGRQGASVLVRVMGIILCSLAVEIVLTALRVGDWTKVAPR